ncbi:MAG: large conductance mechanosensitive channel protein MscL [Micrococcales bacterium]|nr:large conductance mechanosensitive channel protein MscL [Micrococcales bacterium]
MIKEFREFIMRGNVVDLAVAVVIGAAFGAVVKSLVDNLIMPLIALLFGKPNFNDLKFTINETDFVYGFVVTALVNFLLIALAIFLFIVKPMNVINERLSKGKEEEEEEDTELDVLNQIRDSLRAIESGPSDSSAKPASGSNDS